MTTATKRLHISPLTPESLPSVLGPSLLQTVQNISFHPIQTFPENNYGYLDLPADAADKLKKKLNDAILRGRKMKVEDAQPRKRRRTDTEDEAAVSDRKSKGTKRAKREVNTLEGHELSPERKVKRGWTEPKAEKAKRKGKEKKAVSKSQAPSKFTEKQELLFRTKIPQNRKGLDTDDKSKPKKRTNNELIHEFQKTTIQPSFLRDSQESQVNGAVEYEDGRGWVGQDGNVIEEELDTVAQQRYRNKKASSSGSRKAQTDLKENNPVNVALSDTDSSDSQSSVEPEKVTRQEMEEETSSSGTSSSDSDVDEELSSSIVVSKAEHGRASTPPSRLSTESVQNSLHPLEALFKKPKKPVASQDVAKPSLEIATAFSFFDQLEAESKGDELIVPATPFTSQDLRNRGIRSAAPTPDTAHPSRFGSYHSSLTPDPSRDVSDDSVDDEVDNASPVERPATPPRSTRSTKLEESEFEKKFWEKRGENNRAWKARRRAALKEKRQRENRLRRPKNW